MTAGERTRERILSTALPLFAAHGFAGTSVRMVANAADVNVATLAYHFEDKAGLYRSAISRLYEELTHFPLDLSGAPTSTDPLEAAVGVGWRFAVSHRVHIRLLMRHLLDSGRHHELAHEQLEPLLQRVWPVFDAVRPDWGETERRLMVFSVLHLMVRFALEDPDDLRRLLAIEGDIDATIVSWVSQLARARVTL